MKRKILLVTVLVLLMVLTLATLTGNGVVSATATQTVTPEAVEYVEGLNDDKPVHKNAIYSGVEWYGIEYTPTVSYNLKKVLLMAGVGTGNFIVQLRIDVGGWPSSGVLRQTSFTMVDTVMWQGAEFSSSYYVTAGTTYWIVFKPVPNSRASVAWGAGTPITYVWDYDADGWDGKLTSLPWMARFYRDTTGKLDTVLDFWFTPNPVQTGATCTLSGTLKTTGGSGVYPASVKVDYSTNGGATWNYAFTLSTNAAGQFGVSFTAPAAGTYLVRGRYAGSATYNPSSHIETLQIGPTAWGDYHFRLSPGTDVIHIKISGNVIYGVAEVQGEFSDAPLLGYIEGSTFYIFVDIPDGAYSTELSMMVGSTYTLSGNVYRTLDGTSWDGPYGFSLVSASSASASSATESVLASAVEPEAWPPTYHFQLSPWIDIVHLGVSGSVINGQGEAPGYYYGQPILGYVSGSFFILGNDITVTPTIYELSIIRASTSTMTGYAYRTTDGKSFVPYAGTITFVPV